MANFFAQTEALAFGRTAGRGGGRRRRRGAGRPPQLRRQPPDLDDPGRPASPRAVLGQLIAALRAQGVHPGRDLGHQLLRPVGRGAGQGAGRAHRRRAAPRRRRRRSTHDSSTNAWIRRYRDSARDDPPADDPLGCARAVRGDRRPRPQEAVPRPLPAHPAGAASTCPSSASPVAAGPTPSSPTTPREAIDATVAPRPDGGVTAQLLPSALTYVLGQLRRSRHLQPPRHAGSADLGRKLPTCYLAIPPSAFPEVAGGWRRPGSTSAVASWSRSPSAATSHSAPASSNALLHEHFARGPDLPHRPLPGQGGGRGPAGLPLRQHLPRAGLEPQLRRQRADHDGRVVRRRGPRAVLRGGRGACGTWCRTTCSRWWRCWPWSRRPGSDPEALRDETTRCCGPPGRSTRRAWCGASTDGYHDEAGRQVGLDRPRRSSPPASTSTPGAGPACPSTSGPARRLAETSATEALVEFRCPPTLLFADAEPARRPPSRTLLRFRLGSDDGVTLTVQAKTPGPGTGHARPVDLPSTSPPRSASARSPTSACSTTPSTATSAASPARTPWSRRGGSCSRRWTQPGPVHRYAARDLGAGRGRPGPRDGDHWHDPEH